MRLPGADRAVVNADKIREYLLSDAHPVGRFKAAFFGGLGYSAAEWEVLAADLRGHAVENEASATEVNEYGQKYEIRGRMAGPAGKTRARPRSSSPCGSFFAARTSHDS